MQRLVIVGAGGQARDIAWLVEEINARAPSYEVLGFVVSDVSRLGPHDSQDRVLGDYAWLDAHAGDVDALALGIGTPAARLKVASELSSRYPDLAWPTLVHPSVQLDFGSARVAEGVSICAGVVGTVNLVFEPFSLVNPGCTLGHEAHMGRGVVINHGANLAGAVVLEEGVLVGSGAQVLQYLRVGARATVGAGAVVTKNVHEDTTVVGIPARPLVKPRPEG